MLLPMRSVLAVAVLSAICQGRPSNQPIIGIVLEVSDIIPHFGAAKSNEYYALADYKSFVEQAGGGAVPIFVNQPDSYYEQLLPRLNGVLFPGGDVDLVKSPYGKVGKIVYRMAMQMNDAGIYFPVWGTCLGMQEMTTWPLNPRRDILSNCTNTEGISLPLNFTKQAPKSKLFGKAPKFILDILAKENVTPNFHSFCLTTDTYTTNQDLSQFYDVTSTNMDSKGLQFVSSMEAKEYPFYGIQWHPEKNNFEHFKGAEKSLSNTLHGVLISQYCANFLVEEARKNNNTFKSYDEEGRFLFNNYHTTFRHMYELFRFHDSDVPQFDK